MNSKKRLSLLIIGATVTSLMGGTVSTYAADNTETTEPLTIAEQGIFSAGGITITSDGTFNPEDQWEETGAGQTSHVDHANVLYQIPEEETSLPMVFLHGYGQSRMGWMTTPDGREGWAEMFLRDGHSVYLVDEPRRGEAGQTSVSGTISTKTLDQRWYTQFRIGRWEDGKSVPNEGSQFPNDDNSVDQFFRQAVFPHSPGSLSNPKCDWVANEMFEEQGAHDRTVSEVTKGIENLLEQAAHVVIVTNEIFSDAVVFDGDMDSYLEYLGKINQAAAQRADEVVEVIYGIPVFHKSADTCSNLCK